MDECVFCGIAAKRISSKIVYEDASTVAMLDIYPVKEGHTLILPKKHYENIYDMPDDELKNVIAVAKKLSLAYKKAFNADGINLLHATGQAAGQSVLHYHMHLIPRHNGDGLRMWPERTGTGINLDAALAKIQLAMR